MTNLLLLIVSAFLAGGLNSIAGGGSFLTFPALVYAGIPVVSANATSAVAVFPGYIGSTLGFRKELAALDPAQRRRLILLALAGGLIGSLLLLVTSNQTFQVIVPWLLLFATLLFAAGDRLLAWSMARNLRLGGFLGVGVFFVTIYGGYFNGGLGIVLMAVFSVVGMRDIHVMNGMKNGISLVLSAISVLVFAWAGLVRWPEALIMMAAATLGGYLGARIARKLSRKTVKTVIIVVGLLMSAVFFRNLL